MSFTHLDDPSPPAPDAALVERALASGQRRLRRHRWLRRGVIGLTLAVLVVGGTATLTRSDEREGVYADGDRERTAEQTPEFEVLAVLDASPDDMGMLLSAVDTVQLNDLWARVDWNPGGDHPPPQADLERQVVVSVTIPDDACTPELTGFEREGAVLTPTFVEPAAACWQPLIPKTFVVAIDRAAVVPSFTLRLLAQPTYGYDEQRLTVVVPEVGPASDSGDVGALTVSGVMQLVGGPAGTEPTSAAGVVSALNEAGEVVATASTDDEGRFAMQLPPAVYRLTGRSPSYQSGEADCSAGALIVVGDADVGDVLVACRMR